MPIISSEQKENEKLSQIITNSADISALLSEFPAPLEAGSGGPKRKKARADEPDLSQYQSGSSSSGNSSPQHEDDEDESFRVTDVDMWEVLEALELPVPDEGRAPRTGTSADLEASFHETPRSSPNLTGAPTRSAAAAADPGDLAVLPVTGLTGPLIGFTNQPTTGAANKRSAPGGAPRPATTPVKAASKAAASKAAPAAPKEAAASAVKEEVSDVGEDDLESTSCNDPAEEKRLKRMRRNRESAAMSRNRKKAYIEELETKVTSLTSMVQALQSENWALKEENNALRAAKGMPTLDSADARQLVESAPTQPAAADTTLAAPGAGRKLGTAGLALASALTLVTLSVNSTPDGMGSPAVGSRAHAPTSRVMMSMPEDLAGLADPTGMTDAAPLWPSLDLAHAEIEALEAAPATAMLLPPEEAAADAASADTPRHKSSSERVTHLPLNSSWSDALKSEAAAERDALRPKRLQLLPHQPRGWDGKHEPPDVRSVYEAPWNGDDEEIFPDLDASADASQRFIFCARSYAFDVLKTAKGNGKTPAAAPAPPSRELSLPAAMPARFRHAAQASSVRQLTDGSSNNSDGASVPDGGSSAALPVVVNFLLPFDALGGSMAETVHPKRVHNANANSEADLVQVTCQVLNASRFS